MPKIWTQDEVDEVKESWNHPVTPIHTNNRQPHPVFFNHIIDALFIIPAVGGLVYLIVHTATDLMEQYGIIVPVLLFAVVAVVLFTSRKH